MSETRTATSAGAVRIGYEVRDDAGPSAPWALLIHGLGYPRQGWGPVVEPLARRLRLLLPDNRGIGDSDVPPGPYTAAEMAADAVAVLEDAGVGSAHVVGTSLGGMIAQELAIECPDRVDRLVLACTTMGGSEAAPMPEVTQRLLAQARDMAPADALRALVANALSPGARERDPSLVEEIVRLRTERPQDPAGWEGQAAAGTTYDGGGRHERITAPALLIHGTEDAVVAPANSALLAEGLADARVEWFDGAGHLLFWEAPERFAEVVADFLVGEAR